MNVCVNWDLHKRLNTKENPDKYISVYDSITKTSLGQKINGYTITEGDIHTAFDMWLSDQKNPDKDPTVEAIIEYLNKNLRSRKSPEQVKKEEGKIVSLSTEWTRQSVQNDSKSLYIFTDNTNRTSGTNEVPQNSAYYHKYGNNGKEHLAYPNETTAVARGLDNAFPVSTSRYYSENRPVEQNRWTDNDADEFAKIIANEFTDIINAWYSKRFNRIVLPQTFFGTEKSNITQERTPKLYAILQGQIQRLQQAVSGSFKEKENPLDREVESDNAYSEDIDPDAANAFDRDRKLYEDYPDPQQRRDDAIHLARLFSKEVDNAVKEYQDNLRRRIESGEETAQSAAASDEMHNKVIYRALQSTSSKQESAALRAQLLAIDRISAINAMTPYGIFRRVKERIYDSYLNLPYEDKITQVRQEVIDKGWFNEGDPDIDDYVKQRVEAMDTWFNRINDNFIALAEEAASYIKQREKIVVDPTYIKAAAAVDYSADMSEGEDTDNSSDNQKDEDFSMEEAFKDNWMSKKWDTSVTDSLSADIRNYISNLPRMFKEDGEWYIDEDYQGNVRYLDGSYVAITLMDALNKMQSDDDFDAALESLRNKYYFIPQIIEDLNKPENAQLKASFFQNFFKEFTTFGIQRTNGNKIETKVINRPEGTGYLLNEWRNNVESGLQFSRLSIYTKDSLLDKANAEEVRKKLDAINQEINKVGIPEDLFQDDAYIAKEREILDALGINVDPDLLKTALTKKSYIGHAVITVNKAVGTILDGIKKGLAVDVRRDDGTIRRADLFNTFGTAWNDIASSIRFVDETAMESSVRENGKSYYAHSTPSTLGTMMKVLSNSMQRSEEDWLKQLDDEFLKYEWFNKGGHNFNWILDQLIKNPAYRKMLQHKVVLHQDKINSLNWDDIDTMKAILAEYNSDPNGTYANYQIPVLSDISSFEMFRFRKYTDSNIQYEKKEDGSSYSSITEFFTERFTDLFLQEYNRIQLIKERADRYYRQGDHSFKLIPNYDMIMHQENGKWVVDNPGGSEFKFMPYFNNTDVLDAIKAIDTDDSAATTDKIRELLQSYISDYIQTTFNETMDKWNKMGMFDTKEGTNNYLNLEIRKGNNRRFLSQLQALIRETTDEYWNKRLKEELDFYQKYGYIKDLEAIQEVARGTSHEEFFNEVRDPVRAAMYEYFLNSTFMQSQIIELVGTDLSFYKNMVDFQKRNKQIHSSGLRMYTKAKFFNKDTGKLEDIGKENERVIYLRDKYLISNMIDDIDTALQQRVNAGTLTKLQKDYILSQFSNINVADAQAYRTLDSYKSVLGMSGGWDIPQERAYQRFKQGVWDMNDFNTIWQTLKPFVYSQGPVESHTEHGQIKMPVQHKNSEFLLLAGYQMIASSLKNSRLSKLQKFMEDNNIDVVMFESAVKEGTQGVINIDVDEQKKIDGKNFDDTFKEKMKEAQSGKIKYSEVNKAIEPFLIQDSDIYDVLNTKTGIAQNNENPEVVHTIPFKNYMLQTPTPEHGIDVNMLFPTQIRKMVSANFTKEATFKIGNKVLSRDQMLMNYNNTIVANIFEDYQRVLDIFNDPKKVEQVLLDEIKGSNRYSNDLAKAVTIDENGQFTLPLYDITTLNKVSNLLHSVLKNNITKQKIRGGSFIQVSGYGLTDDLNIVFEKDEKTGKKKIKYMEVYMPAYSRKFYEPLMDKDGNLNINDLPEELRRGIGTRIPTESKYSMVPIRIKGFLPQQNGTAVMLPAEITTLSGSDFDVDKLYILLPEFRVEQYDKGRARKVYEQLGFLRKQAKDGSVGLDIKGEGYTGGTVALSDPDESFDTWYSKNKEPFRYLKAKLRYIRPRNINNSDDIWLNYQEIKKMSRQERNNYLINMMTSMLINVEATQEFLTPGGYKPHEDAAALMNIAKNQDINKIIKELGFKTQGDVVQYLLKANSKQLKKIDEGEQVNPLSTADWVTAYTNNMAGKQMIGIYANHSSNQALLQYTDLHVNEKKAPLINGHSFTDFNKIYADNGRYVLLNTSGYLAGGADNGKKPILGKLNQNQFTVDATMVMSRLGYSPRETALVMNQPIVLEMTDKYRREKRTGKSAQMIIQEVINNYQKAITSSQNLNTSDLYTYEYFKKGDTSEARMLANIFEKGIFDQMDKKQQSQYLRRQLHMGLLFQRLWQLGDELATIVRGTRSDSQGGAAGPTIGDTIQKLLNVEQLNKQNEDPHAMIHSTFALQNLNLIDYDGEALEKQIVISPLPYEQAFYTLGVEATRKLFKNYLPFYTQSFSEIMYGIPDEGEQGLIPGIMHYTKTGRLSKRTLNDITQNYISYMISKSDLFKTRVNEHGNVITAEQKRRFYINDFPIYFRKFKQEHADLIEENPFLKRLFVKYPDEQNPLPSIVFTNVGKLTTDNKEKFMRDWASMVYNENKDVRHLATSLFMYSYYRNGLNFGPSTFAHLASTFLKLNMPGYKQALEDMLDDSKISKEDKSGFINQYLLNHLDNVELVPQTDDSKFDKKTNTITIDLDNETPANYEERPYILAGNPKDGYTFARYVRIESDGKYKYMMLDSSVSDLWRATYKEIHPLGLKYNYVEYEAGVEFPNSVIDAKVKQEDTTPDPTDNNTNQDEPSPEDFFTDGGGTDEYRSTQPVTDQAVKQSYKDVTGDNLPQTQQTEDEPITPDTDYKDATDQKICGADNILDDII